MNINRYLRATNPDVSLGVIVPGHPGVDLCHFAYKLAAIHRNLHRASVSGFPAVSADPLFSTCLQWKFLRRRSQDHIRISDRSFCITGTYSTSSPRCSPRTCNTTATSWLPRAYYGGTCCSGTYGEYGMNECIIQCHKHPVSSLPDVIRIRTEVHTALEPT